MSLLRASQWTYETGASGGLNAEFFVMSGGTVVLKDPSQKSETFYYGGMGAGIGFGLKLPRIKLSKWTLPEVKAPTIRGVEVGAAGSAKSFDSAGIVYMTDSFLGCELTRTDLEGGALYIDAGLGLFYGKAGSAMLLGINPAPLLMGLSSPGMSWLAQQAVSQAPALLFMGGTTVGMLAGGGIGMLVGYLH